METQSPTAQPPQEEPAPTPWDDVRPEIEVAVAVSPGDSALSASSRSPVASGGAFTIPLICLGVGVIAMCLLIPAADEVRRLAYERDRLKADLEQ